MSDESTAKPSFSPASRWRIGIDVMLRTLLVIAVVGMLNYLGTRFYHRFHWSSQTQAPLSSHTLAILRSLTNRVDVTVYYDRTTDFYPDIVALLKEYSAANKNISVRTVDYLRDPGAAEILNKKYAQNFVSPLETNVVIFDCGGNVRVFPGDRLTSSKSTLTGWRADNSGQRVAEFERHVVSFNGEQAFSSILLVLANPQPLKVYFLQGHGEVSLTDSSERGFLRFLTVLQENSINVENLNWVGAGVPADCNLLVIAAPYQALKEPELQQIGQYLREGGKLLVMFGYNSQGHPTGLETLLKTWGVGVLDDIAQDFQNSTTTQGYDIMVNHDLFGRHPVMDPLSQMQLQVYLPRPIYNLNSGGQPANAPQVDVLFVTSAGGTLMADRSAPPVHYPLACAVEQKPVAGVSNPRGNTRIIIAGDATFLGNKMIDSGGNRDFLNSAVNWLCDRPMLISGIGPRPVTNFRMQITQHQQRQLTWLLLGVLPGTALVFGWFVWLVRRR